MENKNAMAEVIKQTKKIEENNFFNQQFSNSISMLLTSNDLARPKNPELSKRFDELNRKIEDINTLTSDLLNDLSSRHN